MRPLVALPLILALAIPAGAHHCTTFTTEQPELTIPADAMGSELYVDNDLCQLECLYSVWIYQESNGIAGLQRGDYSVDGTCHGLVDPDSLFFY